MPKQKARKSAEGPRRVYEFLHLQHFGAESDIGIVWGSGLYVRGYIWAKGDYIVIM